MAAESGIQLDWNPLIESHEKDELLECPDIAAQLQVPPESGTRREQGKRWTKDRNRKLHLRYQELKALPGNRSDLECVRIIADELNAKRHGGKLLTKVALRRILSEKKKKEKEKEEEKEKERNS